jgi:hypothetical protein
MADLAETIEILNARRNQVDLEIKELEYYKE